MSFMSTDDSPLWEVIHDERPRARRAYQCNACGGEIAKGARYRRIAAKDDGEFRVHREHDEDPCLEAAR